MNTLWPIQESSPSNALKFSGLGDVLTFPSKDDAGSTTWIQILGIHPKILLMNALLETEGDNRFDE